MAVPMARREIVVPEGVEAKLAGRVLTMSGPKGTLTEEFGDAAIRVSVDQGRVSIASDFPSTRKLAIFGMYEAIIKNMIDGVTRGFRSRLRMVSSHFPMSTEIKEGEVLINNFIGERYPRRARIYPGVSVGVEGEYITVSGIDRDGVAQTAANIEQATVVRHKDRRIFQDGIYLVAKAAPAED